MDLKEQKYVCTLAECRNLTRAAEKLYISQPALSIYITNLEKSLGTALFERTNKGFSLTYAGEKYVERARKMLELEREFHDDLASIMRERSGRVRLGLPSRRGPCFLPPVLARYDKKFPAIEVILREGNLADLNELLRNNELDLVIISEEDKTADMEVYELFEEELLLAVPPLHPINERAQYAAGERYRKIDPRCLDGQPLFCRVPWQSMRRVEEDILKRFKIRPGRIRIVRGSDLMLQLIAEGLGMGFIRESFARTLYYPKAVNYYSLDMEKHRHRVIVAHKKGLALPEYAKALIAMLQERGREFLASS